MADKVLVNLATGLEDSERVTIAFLVAGAALERGARGGDVPDQGGGPPGRAGPRRGLSPATAARRWSGCSSSSRRPAASCWPARSASTRAGWTPTASWPTPAWPAAPRCSTGWATRAARSSATDRRPPAARSGGGASARCRRDRRRRPCGRRRCRRCRRRTRRRARSASRAPLDVVDVQRDDVGVGVKEPMPMRSGSMTLMVTVPVSNSAWLRSGR